MAGYDPKAKRAHSPAAEERAPVDDLLGAAGEAEAEPVPDAAADDLELFETFGADAQPTADGVAEEVAATRPVEPTAPVEPMAPVEAPPRPAPARPAPAPTPSTTSGSGPRPKVLAAVAAVVAILAIWRWRRR